MTISDKIKCCSEILLPFRDRVWLAGCSGGADSVFTLLRAAELAQRRLIAVYFEHNLRGAEGRRDGDFVRELCESRNIEFRHIDLDVPLSGNLEENARRCRMQYWQEAQKEFPGAIVILGHHAGDRRENLILRLLRGSNASGLSAMREVNELAGITLVRPALHLEREEIEQFLAGEGVTDWRTDCTNSDNSIGRNYLRNVFFKRFPKEKFDRTLEALECDARYLEQEASRMLEPVKSDLQTGAAFWGELHPALRQRAVRNYLSHHLGYEYIPDQAFARRFADFLENKRCSMPLDNKFCWKRTGESLHLVLLKKPFRTVTGNWKTGELSGCLSWHEREHFSQEKLPLSQAAFDPEQLPEVLMLALPEPGESMQIFPGGREEKLKKLRTDRKIPPGQPVLKTLTGEIIWYPNIRHGNLFLPRPGGNAVIFNFTAII